MAKKEYKKNLKPGENPFYNPAPYRPMGQKQTVYQGSGAIAMIADICKYEGWKRALLCIDPGVLKAGSADGVIKICDQAGIEYKIFSDIKPNPMASDIEDIGLPLFRSMKADVLIAVGGGSTMDTAKGIALIGDSDMTVKEVSELSLCIHPLVECEWKTYPVIAIPTTCGTGSEVIRNAVISESDHHKMVLQHDAILPKYAIEDPDLLASLPAHVAADTAMDALVQSFEAYVSRASTEFSRLCGRRALELIAPVIVAYVRNPADKEIANKISLGSMFGGMSWNGSFVCQIHGCNHPITEMLGIPHGAACAILLPWFVEWNGENCKERFWEVRNAMYPMEPVAFKDYRTEEFVQRLMKLNYDLNILDNLTMDEYVKKYGLAEGCDDEMCDRIIDAQFKPTLYTFPRKTTKDEMKKALRDVNAGKYIYRP